MLAMNKKQLKKCRDGVLKSALKGQILRKKMPEKAQVFWYKLLTFIGTRYVNKEKR
jgi:hypothetical protein